MRHDGASSSSTPPPIPGWMRIARHIRLPNWGHNATIFLWYTLTKGLTLAIYGLVFNLYLNSLGYDKSIIGVLNALPALTSLLCSVPLGVLGDRLGPRTMLLLTGVLTPLVMLGLSVSTSVPWLALFALANGAVTTFYWVSGIPLLAESTTPELRVRLFSLNSFLLWGAGALGYTLGGQVVQWAATILHQSVHGTGPLRWGMLAIVVVGILGALPLPWLRVTVRPRRTKAERAPYNLALYLRLLGPDVLLTCGGGSVAGFIGLYLSLRFGVHPAALGTFLTLSGFLGGVLVLLAPRAADRWGTARAAVALQAAGTPAIIVLALAPNTALAMGGEIMRNAARSMGDPVYNAFVMSQVPPEQRATISGLYATTWSVGFSLGPAFSGVVQQHAGFGPAFLLGATSMAAGATWLWVFFLRGRTTVSIDTGNGLHTATPTMRLNGDDRSST